LVKGLIDNIIISKEYRLAKLHSLTVRRLNIDFLERILSNVNEDNPELLCLLLKANNYIDIELLREIDNEISNEYIIEPIKKMCLKNGYKSDLELIGKLDKVTRDLECIQNSLSFKIGRTLTYVPRKLRDILKNK